jgi:hypothetical protein
MDLTADDSGAPRYCRPEDPCLYVGDWFLYDDMVCSPPASLDAGPSCHPYGDGQCHLSCTTDADCQVVGLTTCGTITRFHGGDLGVSEGACEGTEAFPSCSTFTDAGAPAGCRPWPPCPDPWIVGCPSGTDCLSDELECFFPCHRNEDCAPPGTGTCTAALVSGEPTAVCADPRYWPHCSRTDGGTD